MSDCCSSSNTRQLCYECGSSCKSVSMSTLYHQVRSPENQSIVSDNYYFCSTKICLIAYFSNTGNTIPKQYLRNYQSMQNNALCYCFDIDAEQYLSALKDQRAESIKAFVIQRTQTGECACEIRNPSGQCCLANFKNLEKIHRESLT